MVRRLVRGLATVLTVTLGFSVLASTPGAANPIHDPCPPDSGISINEYIMWDDVNGGTADLVLWSRIPCRYARILTYRTFDITATSGDDYVGVMSGQLVFPAGRTSTTLSIQILGDVLAEGEEKFGVRLIDGASFDDATASVTLVDLPVTTTQPHHWPDSARAG